MSDSEWADESSSSDSDSDIEERKGAIYNVLTTLEKERHLKCLDTLGRGTYGDVMLMYDEKTKVKHAAKIVIGKNIIPFEQEIWPKLDHENVLKVEKMIELLNETVIFLTSLKFKSLCDIVCSQRFRQSYQHNYNALRSWLKDALLGMTYMHNNGYCHLDLKLDNVLIGHDGRACVCDFSFVNRHCGPLSSDDIGLPDIYRPPESFRRGKDGGVDGIAVDMWAYGILVLEAFTDQYILEVLDTCESWTREAKPVLEHILEEEYFKLLVSETFPNGYYTETDVCTLLDFIDCFLRVLPQQRISPQEALEHSFLQGLKNFVVVLSEIYSKEELNTEYILEGKSIEQTENVCPNPVLDVQPSKSHANIRKTKGKKHSKVGTSKRFLKAKMRMRRSKMRKPKMQFRCAALKDVMPYCVLKEDRELASENSAYEQEDNQRQIVQVANSVSEHEGHIRVSKTELNQDIASELIAQDLANEPIAQDSAGEPIAQDSAGEPIAQDSAGESIAQDLASDPIAQDSASNPIAQYSASNPIAQDLVSALIAQDIVSESVVQELVKESYSAPISEKDAQYFASFDDFCFNRLSRSSSNHSYSNPPSSLSLDDAKQDLNVITTQEEVSKLPKVETMENNGVIEDANEDSSFGSWLRAKCNICSYVMCLRCSCTR